MGTCWLSICAFCSASDTATIHWYVSCHLCLFSSLPSTSFLHPSLPSFLPPSLPSFLPFFFPCFPPSLLASFLPSVFLLFFFHCLLECQQKIIFSTSSLTSPVWLFMPPAIGIQRSEASSTHNIPSGAEAQALGRVSSQDQGGGPLISPSHLLSIPAQVSKTCGNSCSPGQCS